MAITTGCEESIGAMPDQGEVLATSPVGSPRVEDVHLEREYVCEIRALRYAEVRSRTKGILEKVAVDEGQMVAEGALLFSVNARELRQEHLVAQAAVSSAEAELVAAELERENTELLFEKNVVSKAELALAEARVKILQAKVGEARAEADRAEIELEFAQVRAPFEGRVNRLPRREGSAILEDDLLTSMCDASEVYAYFRFSEREALEYFQTQPSQRPTEVALRLVDGSLYAERGRIDAVESEIDPETGNLAYRARFVNPTGVLKHGSRAKIVLRQMLPASTLVPQSATFDVQGNLYVYVLDQEGFARMRKIVPRCRVGGDFVVDSGLDREERILLEGIQRVRDGQRIAALVPERAKRG